MEEGVKGVTVVIGEEPDEAPDKWQPCYHSFSLPVSFHLFPCFLVGGGESRSTISRILLCYPGKQSRQKADR